MVGLHHHRSHFASSGVSGKVRTGKGAGNVRNRSISVLGFGTESGRWPPDRKAVTIDFS